jgi:hypothetical protein
VKLGNGDGTFQAPVCIPSNPSARGSTIVGDFNGDGKQDLAVANGFDGTNTVSIFIGNGDGTFQTPLSIVVGINPNDLVAGDFNGDGKMDLAVTDYPGCACGRVFVLLGNGDGTFLSLPYDYLPSSSRLLSPVVGDFNRDGKLDLVIPDEYGLVWLLPGKGDGTFQSAQQIAEVQQFAVSNQLYADLAVAGPAALLSTADLNGDGNLDLVVTSLGGPPGYEVILGNGNGTFQTPVRYAIGDVTGGVCAPVLDDINADGKLDVAGCQGFAFSGLYALASTASIQLGNGDGSLQTPTNLPLPSPDVAGLVSGVVVADFNGDGKADLLYILNDFAQPPSKPTSLLVFLQGSFPQASVSPNTLQFSQAFPGPSSPQTIVVTNTGGASVNFGSIVVTGQNASDFTVNNTCAPSLPVNSTCHIDVTFAPSALGSRTAILNISDNVPGSPQQINLSANATGFRPVVSPASISFPAQFVGTSGAPQMVTVTASPDSNDLTRPIRVTVSPNDYAILNNCVTPIQTFQGCVIGVFFDPTQTGSRNGTLTIAYDSGPGSPQTIALSGVGQDFSFAPTVATTTVKAGQTGLFTVNLNPEGGLRGTVALSCTGAPPTASCVVPAPVTLNGSAGPSILVSVSTTAASSLMPTYPKMRMRWIHSLGLVAQFLGVLVITMIAILARVWFRKLSPTARWAAIPLFICVTLGVFGCAGQINSGSNSGSSVTRPGTAPGTYTLTLTGSLNGGPTNVLHTTTLTLVVE